MKENTRLLRLPEVIDRTGLSKASIYRYVQLGKFPAPVIVGERAAAWVQSEIDTWIAARIIARRELARHRVRPL